MKRISVLVSALFILLAACSGSAGSEVATLEAATADVDASQTEVATDQSDEDAILAFSACMRDNGIEDFEDPEIDAEGQIAFRFGGSVDGDVDRDAMRTAMDACRIHLDGLSLARGDIDRTEIEDQLVEFAACMRDNGYDMPDPDFSNAPGEGGPGNGPFAGIDQDDLDFQSAFEACQEVFGGGLRIGPGAGRGGGA